MLLDQLPTNERIHMDSMKIAQKYFDGWNEHNTAVILSTFSQDGYYTDPISGKVQGEALAAYANGLFAAFPDLSFEISSVAPLSDKKIAAQWLMRGTNLGSFNGLPPTNKTISLSGADFIEVAEEGIISVEGYFDSRAVPAQLGLQIHVQPYTLGPFTFGTSTYVQIGKKVKPGAFSLTSMVVRSEQEKEKVRENSIRIMKEMTAMPGFISTMGVITGNKMSTITAWEDASNTRLLMQSTSHKEGVSRFFANEFGSSAMTSVWVADHMNALWVRCDNCGKAVDYEKSAHHCTCGEPLPEVAYW